MSTHRTDDQYDFFKRMQQRAQQAAAEEAIQEGEASAIQIGNNLQKTSAKQGADLYQSSLQSGSAKGALLATRVASSSDYSKPTLSEPKGSGALNFYNQFGGMTSSGTNLIAIMAQVLILQTLSNSDFWQTTWEQATQQMMSSIALAPSIAQATQDNWNEQAHISELQGQESLMEGIVNTVAFGVAIGLGAYSTYNDPTEAPKNQPDGTKLTKEDIAPATKETNLDSEIQESTNTRASNPPEQQGTWDKIKSAFQKVQDAYGKGPPVLKSITKGMEMSQGLMLLSTGITGIQKKMYQVKIAAAQQLVGTYQAATEQLQAYAQFYENAFNRINSINQGSAQQISSIADTISQIAATIAQAISAGFNRI